MKALCTNLLIISLIFAAGCASGESYVKKGFDFNQLDKVAVIDVQGQLRSEAAKNQVADFLQMELLKKGYSPIERAQVQALLKEQKFQAGDVTSPVSIAQAGRILNVPTVMVISIPKFSEDINMTIKMIDVEDGTILWMGSGQGTTGQTLATIAGAAAGAAGRVMVSGEDDQALGGIAGGVLGGVAARSLSPQQAQTTQKIIKKITLTLPQRR